MSLLTRVVQKVFGNTAGSGEFGVIGSKSSGSASTTKDLDLMQGDSNYDLGLNGITNDQGTSRLPYTEDMNSLFYLITTQLKYLFQSGIPEYDEDEDYYKDISLVIYDGKVWKSTFGVDLDPNNDNQPNQNLDKWELFLYSGLNVAALRLFTGGTDNQEIKLAGYYDEGDTNIPAYYWDSESTDTDNGGTIIKPTAVSGEGRWTIKDSSYLDVKWFGAIGDGSTDDTDAIQNAIDAGTTIFFSDGTYKIDSLTISKSIRIYGNNKRNVSIQVTESNTINALSSDITIEEVEIKSYSTDTTLITLKDTSATGAFELRNCEFGAATYHVYLPTGTSNTGYGVDFRFENCRFRFASVISRYFEGGNNVYTEEQCYSANNSGKVLFFDYQTGQINLIGSTFEYNGGTPITFRTGVTSSNAFVSAVRIMGCYFEGNITDSSETETYEIYLRAEDATRIKSVEISNCFFAAVVGDYLTQRILVSAIGGSSISGVFASLNHVGNSSLIPFFNSGSDSINGYNNYFINGKNSADTYKLLKAFPYDASVIYKDSTDDVDLDGATLSNVGASDFDGTVKMNNTDLLYEAGGTSRSEKLFLEAQDVSGNSYTITLDDVPSSGNNTSATFIYMLVVTGAGDSTNGVASVQLLILNGDSSITKTVLSSVNTSGNASLTITRPTANTLLVSTNNYGTVKSIMLRKMI